MSEENVKLARDGYDAFNRRDWDAFAAVLHEEVEMESRLIAIEGGYHGREGMRRWWDDFLGTFPDYKIELKELRDLGEVTLSNFEGWGHGGGSGTPLVDPVWQPIRWREGKMIWVRVCATEAEALEAAGLSG